MNMKRYYVLDLKSLNCLSIRFIHISINFLISKLLYCIYYTLYTIVNLLLLLFLLIV